MNSRRRFNFEDALSKNRFPQLLVCRRAMNHRRPEQTAYAFGSRLPKASFNEVVGLVQLGNRSGPFFHLIIQIMRTHALLTAADHGLLID